MRRTSLLAPLRALHAGTILFRRGWGDPRILRTVGRHRRKLGPCLAAAFAASAERRPDAPGLVDERGSLSFAELHDRVLRAAAGLADLGVGPGSRVGLLCRNHRDFVIAAAAAGLLRARLVYLNTGSGAPEVASVALRESLELLIHDRDLSDAVCEVPQAMPRVLCWAYDGAPLPADAPTLAVLSTGPRRLETPPSVSATDAVILTSGTTGPPRGALRQGAGPSRLSFVLMLERFPLNFDRGALLSAPLFHAWGHGMLTIAALTSTTVILERRFDPVQALATIERHRPELLVVTPTMLQRILELPADVRRAHDTSSLRLATSSGAPLSGHLAARWMDAFGDNLYSFYGSTELHVVTFATPRELRRAPGTVGRPVPEVEVRVVDTAGRDAPRNVTGRVVVRSPSRFAGYTDGSAGTSCGDMLVTRDLGHIDGDGLLHIDGREDDVIISGGEKVLPGEVEDLLGRHPAVLEVAVIGVSDPEFGERLKAFVVSRGGDRSSEEELKSYVREKLARHKVPREIEFVPELPKTNTGKVLRRALAAANRTRDSVE